MLLGSLALIPLAALLSFLPGYGLLVHVRRLSPAERIACSGLFSGALVGTAALAVFLLAQATTIRLSTWPAIVAPLLLGGAALWLAASRGRDLRLDAAARQVAILWLLLLVELLALELVLPTFGGAGWFADWWVHFHRALVYANLVSVQDVARTCIDPHLHCVAPTYDNGVLTTRTPLYNLLGGTLVGIDDGRMAAFQIAAAAWGALLAGPVVLLAQRRGLRCGRLAGCLLLLNPFLIHLAIYPWPKVLTAAYEVLAIYWLCRMRDGAVWAGVAAAWALGMAVFTHTSAMIYLFAAALYLCWQRRPRWDEARALLVGLAAVAVVALPWIVWGMHTYGWRGVLLSSPTTQPDQPAPSILVAHKLGGLVYSFVPMPMAHALADRPFGHLWLTVNSALQFPFDTYTGAQGAVACLLLLRWYPRARLSTDARRLGWIVVICAALGAVLLDSAFLTGGGGAQAMAGATALGIAFLASLEPTLQHSRSVIAAVGAEMAAVFGLYLAYLSIGSWQSNPNVPVLAGMGQQLLSADLGPTGVVVAVLLCAGGTLAAIAALPRQARIRRDSMAELPRSRIA